MGSLVCAACSRSDKCCYVVEMRVRSLLDLIMTLPLVAGTLLDWEVVCRSAASRSRDLYHLRVATRPSQQPGSIISLGHCLLHF